MAATTDAPQQRTQPSRKGKKAWRKNIDVSTVESGLDELRDEIAHGGVIAEKSSSELFAIDTTGSAQIKKQVLHKQHRPPLKADEILAERSAIPAVASRKRPINSRLTNGIIEPSTKRQRGPGYVSHKELQRLKAIAYGDGEQENVDLHIGDDTPAAHDPWAATERVQDPRFSFLPETKAIREPDTLKYTPIVLSANGRPFAAVRKPDAGRSYNPDFHDWTALLTREGQKEIEAEKKRLQQAEEDRILQQRIAAATVSDAESFNGDSAWESEWEGIGSSMEDSRLKQKRSGRKTPQQQRKAKRRKEAERQAKLDAQAKAKQRQTEMIEQLAREVEEKAMQIEKQPLAIEEDSLDGEEVLRRKRFGKATVPKAPLELVLPYELQDSLRLLKPEGNLLKDRYRNMIIRGKIESRKGVQRKQAKTTVTEKWSYKDWTLATGR